jgi:uncharacterized membrane protein
MPLELAAVAFDGAFTADKELNNLRVSRLDPWVGEVAVLEHHHGGRYFTRATSPGYGGGGYGRPPGPLLMGTLIGVIVDWAAGAIGSPQTTGAFGVLADLVRGVLPADTSALMLVAESPAAEKFVSAVAPRGGLVIRQELSDQQVQHLRLGAART